MSATIPCCMSIGKGSADGLNREKVAGEVLADGQTHEMYAGEVLADGLKRGRLRGGRV